LRELGRTDDGAAWLVHDLVDGSTLAACAPLQPGRVQEIGRTLAATLAAAHARDVHHGDISPTNVIIDGHGAPLLADFGVAGLGHAPDDPGGLTPAYAAPERLRGAPPSAASDVWSLAATLDAVADAPSDRLLRGLLARCRSIDPAQRPSAGVLADELAPPERH
jgi:serine/threonine protein kinase